MILVLDAYDSFVETLARYVREAGREARVERADAMGAEAFLALRPDAVFLSPGPKRPAEAGAMIPLIRAAPPDLPIFGVCLGHQAICEAFGGRTEVCDPVHGRASRMEHADDPLFEGVPSPFEAARYHSLIGVPAADGPLTPIAWGDGGAPMAVRHATRPVVGVQFHPESVLTPSGRRMVENVLAGAPGRKEPA